MFENAKIGTVANSIGGGIKMPDAPCVLTNKKSAELEVVCVEQKDLIEQVLTRIADLRTRLSPVLVSTPQAGCSAEKRCMQAPLAVFLDGNNDKLRASLYQLNDMLDALQM